MAVTVLSNFEILLASDAQLSVVGSFFSLADWHSIRKTSKNCKTNVDRWITEEMHTFIEHLKGTNASTLLIFGNHGVYRNNKQDNLVSEKFLNPAPILRFSFNALGYDATKREIIGKPWSLLPSSNQQPSGLGRIDPIVIATNDDGSEIMYCGGYGVAKNNNRWLPSSEIMFETASSKAGLFDVKTASWSSLPSMPYGRSKAGVCRVGSRIIIIGGETGDDSGDSGLTYTRSVLCFDTINKEWVDNGIPDFPGRAFAGFAVVVDNNHQIFVAGGEIITEYHEEYGPIIGTSREVFSFTTSSKVWSRLPDLPEHMVNDGCLSCNGFLMTDPRNTGDNRAYPTFSLGRRSAYLEVDEFGMFGWKELADMPTDDGRESEFSIARFGGGKMAAFFESFSNRLFDARLNKWWTIPSPKHQQGSLDIGLKLADSNDDEVLVYLGKPDTTIAVTMKQSKNQHV